MKAEIRLCLLVCLVAGVILFPSAAKPQGTRPQQFQPGFRTLGIWNSSTQIRMDVAVWYPTLRSPRDMRIDGWSILVSKNAREAPGQYPVILLSHDAGSSRLSTHDLAASLARQGFLVIAPTHPGDNSDDTADLYHAALFQSRPRHLLLALEAVLAAPELASLVDESRIGLLGVGSGAVTVLQLAGAVPDLSDLSAYCAGEQGSDPLCTGWARTRHAAMQKDYASILAAQGAGAFTPELGLFAAPEAPPKAADSDVPHDGEEDETTRMASPVPAPLRTPPTPAVAKRPASRRQIKAVGLMTPGWIGLFSESSLRAVAVPLGILDVADDVLYPTAGNTKALVRSLPARPVLRTLEHGGHYAVQVPCPPVSADSFAALCSGRNERDSEAARQRNAFFAHFFQRELGAPLPPLPAPPEQPKRQSALRAADRGVVNATVSTVPAAAAATVNQGNKTRQDNGTAVPERTPARRPAARR